MIKSILAAEQVEIVCSSDAIFTEYSFALEQGIDWYFGRGVSAFKVERSKNNTEQLVKITPLMPVKVMAYSLVTSVGVMAKEHYWPKDIPFEKIWKISGPRQEVKDGQHRVFRTSKEGSIIQQYGLDPATSIGLIAYGLADLITGFFWLGATWVQYQGSLGVVQIMTDKGFEGDELVKYLADSEPGYSIHQKVSTLA